jgi:hypothetical protein
MAEEVIINTQEYLESVGLRTPTSRFIVGAGMGVLLTEAIRPGFSHDAKGQHRPWAILDPGAKDGTQVPWFLPPVISGTVLALLL